MDATGITPQDLPRGVRRKGWFWGALIALGAMAVGLAGFVTFNTWQTAHEVQKAQTNHAETLRNIDAIVKALKTDRGLVIIGTQHGLADYQAICNAIPGCTLPYP